MTQYMPIKEFARRLGVSYGTIYKMLTDPTGCKVPGAIKLCSTWRIPETAIAEMEAKR